MKYLLLSVMAAISILQRSNSIKQFDWLKGNWKLEGKQVYEKWQTVNDTMLGGIGYHFMVEEHEKDEMDIIFDESIRLVSRNDKFFYIPAPRNQNQGKEVEFQITSFTKNSFTAENSKHDFPTRIVYKLLDQTHLHAYIEGKNKSKKKRIDYYFQKQKKE
jgi:hypothetical protein